MNRPFAILKDLLPTRDKPAREKPAAERRPAASGNKSKSDRRKTSGTAPESRPQRDPANANAAPSPAKRVDTQTDRRPAATRGRPGGPRQEERKPRPAGQRQQAPATPVDPEQARKAAERAAKMRALADEGLNALQAHHPGLFNALKVKPLAIGIHKPLLDSARVGTLGGASVAAVRAAIGRWTNSRHYLQALQADAVRVALDGSPAGVVDTEQAAAAQAILDERAARNANRRRGGKGKPGASAGGAGKSGESKAAGSGAKPAAGKAATGSKDTSPAEVQTPNAAAEPDSTAASADGTTAE